MEGFHKRYMNGQVACRKLASIFQSLSPSMIAPQHGAIFKGESVSKFLNWLSNMRCGLDIINEVY